MFQFPNPVNELAARTVAGGVLLATLLTLGLSAAFGTGWLALTFLIAYGFVARVLTGPTLSPLGQLATRVIAPRLGPARPVPGPPKRFAQGMGATFTVTAAGLHLAGYDTAAGVLLVMIVGAATLESVFGYCLGCTVFGWLMRAGVIPPETCAACQDLRLPAPSTAA